MMITLHTGLNGQGKTIGLLNLVKNSIKSKSVVTNLKDVEYQGLNELRAKIATSEEVIERVFDYLKVVKAGNKIIDMPEGNERGLSKKMFYLINLMCSDGDILIIDEPERGLSELEVFQFMDLMIALKQTYDEIHIATHCYWLFPAGDRIFWYSNYNSTEVQLDELYRHIPTI